MPRHALIGLGLATLLASGCGGTSVSSFNRRVAPQQPTIAVASLSINDFGGSLQGWNRTRTSDLMGANANQMLFVAEQALATHYRVIPAGNFIQNPAYQWFAGPMPEVSVPFIAGARMPVFARDRGQLVRGQLDPSVAAGLCQATGADYVAVIYSEWGVLTGSYVPTSKALTKNRMTLYDSRGVLVATSRRDQRGERTLGALGRVVVDAASIGEWVGAYARAITLIVN